MQPNVNTKSLKLRVWVVSPLAGVVGCRIFLGGGGHDLRDEEDCCEGVVTLAPTYVF